ncbi:methionine ABC transporter ATP-binding protein [Bacillus sp. JCM 19046]|uniref:D-methionine transport system ATP-binding protein n=1 Tax=Shouchella xiaoxiensis TaxID=766895 RepID=A0ABS2SUR4_9BACI|nr:ATP-binding cassette domain-containing protein [Shouchella xiaoxiensis]MBM7839242.1 D-methionine transport system ATP-binding protein [Shouchella xiaoxiensis]GAF13067.1 methionine ABC transporter ATP-binding protein [Bacillus sp. JCM 19045]GAF15719.1 methionine ABC transporter ATP-binding protein [Bacillus sp. JCM 19046]
MIVFDGVSKSFQSNKQAITALDNVNLTIETGDIYGVIGFSGAGKSTLLRCVNQLEKPTSGAVWVDGKNLATLRNGALQKEKRSIGMIFQHFNLLQSKTVFDNVAMPLRLVRTSKAEVNQRVTELLSFVGLSDKAKSYPEQLSGGQKQRIGIARALATNPSILLCDEATSALDPETTSSILQLLKKVNREYKITILLITHEMAVVREVCHKVAVMEAGKVVESGSVPAVFASPQHETTKKFVQSVIPNTVPQSVLELVKKVEADQTVLEVSVSDQQPSTTLISELTGLGVSVDLLYASMNEVQGTSFGKLYIALKGSRQELAIARTYLEESHFKVREVNKHAELVA